MAVADPETKKKQSAGEDKILKFVRANYPEATTANITEAVSWLMAEVQKLRGKEKQQSSGGDLEQKVDQILIEITKMKNNAVIAQQYASRRA